MNIDLSRFAQVFDVGANTGQFARRALEAGCEVVSFEPLADIAARLGGRRWRAFAVGLANQCGPRTFYRNDTTVCSSLKPMLDLHKTAYPFSAQDKEVTCAFMTLDCFADLIGEQSLLKIDTQGSEWEVLLGGRRSLARFEAVLLEVSHAPLYDGVASFAELDLLLCDAGFIHSERVDEMRHPTTDELLQTDELWVRSS